MRVHKLRQCDDLEDYLWRVLDELRLIGNIAAGRNGVTAAGRIDKLRNQISADLVEAQHYKSLTARVAALEALVTHGRREG
jgi:hypothetical protein